MLSPAYYAQNYASIIGASLLGVTGNKEAYYIGLIYSNVC